MPPGCHFPLKGCCTVSRCSLCGLHPVFTNTFKIHKNFRKHDIYSRTLRRLPNVQCRECMSAAERKINSSISPQTNADMGLCFFSAAAFTQLVCASATFYFWSSPLVFAIVISLPRADGG